MPEEVSLGGNLNQAVRVGDTVRRRAGPWTPAVHALLRYLESVGFEAPRVLGIDEVGREVLAYIPGEAFAGGENAVPDRVFDEEHLVRAARLLRQYHDTVVDFQPPSDAKWRLTAPTRPELICHNDWSPWNALFRDEDLAVFLDWDLAGPGSRLWDVANSAACWVTLFSESKLFSVSERAQRLRLFCDAYGLVDRSELLATIRLRNDHVARFIEARARAGEPGFVTLARWDTPAKMDDDLAWLDQHRSTFEHALK
ncbi:MAG: aminoglycoside phosphotransferase family protein [Chloroflexi bacterium]|nr:MAG: aminoglycoside phosphotransferase family protein [Chloroflexota bacterium]TMF54310.1 MAG: aminoglycoside phosphotransferase family protein [Chloroflexota bacterium]